MMAVSPGSHAFTSTPKNGTLVSHAPAWSRGSLESSRVIMIRTRPVIASDRVDSLNVTSNLVSTGPEHPLTKMRHTIVSPDNVRPYLGLRVPLDGDIVLLPGYADP